MNEPDVSADESEDSLSPARLEEARRALEAVLMVVDAPAEPSMLAQLIELPTDTVERVLVELAESYESETRGFQLVRVGGGWRFQSHPDCAPWVERFVLSGQSQRLSAAALETLAIVAYKQPISRGQIAAIRGVNVDGVVRTLEARGYIAEVGRDDGPGLAIMYGTTREFLERLGIDDLSELPSLGDFIPGAEVVEALEHGLRPGDDRNDHDEADHDEADHDEAAVTVADDAVPAANAASDDGPGSTEGAGSTEAVGPSGG